MKHLKRTAGAASLELAQAHQREGRHEQARAVCQEVLRKSPTQPGALFLLGTLELTLGRAAAAVKALEGAVKAAPYSAAYATNLGLAYARAGDLARATDTLRRAVGLDPALTPAAHNLGLVLCDRGQFEEGLTFLRRAAEAEPSSFAIRYSYGKGLLRAQRVDEAVAAFEAAIELSPTPGVHVDDFVSKLEQSGQLRQGAEVARRSLERWPELALGHAALGRMESRLGRYREAADSFRRAISLAAKLEVSLVEPLAFALTMLGRLDEAIACREHALTLDPTQSVTHSSLVYWAAFRPELSGEDVLAVALGWNERHARPLLGRRRPFPHDRAPERRLRVGYVSPDFRDHVLRFFMLPVFSCHDHSAFEIVCFSSVHFPNEWTARIRAQADAWHDVSRLDDAQLAQKIRDERVDVLVDLTMHMPGGRLKTFAEKPAPVQLTWLAYPGTTGIDGMDYRITDPFLDPPGAPLPYSERSLWLPRTFWCYHPGSDEPAVGPLPALSAGHVTFGCLNTFTKVSRGTLELWARVLAAVPQSKLLLFAAPGWARDFAAEVLEAQGVSGSRLEFVGLQKRPDYLKTYQRIDIALDCLPYNGHTTSLDGLWMGVPVVTLVGKTIVGRAGLCIAENLELGELVAKTPDEFVAIATRLASSLPRLSTLRQELRARLMRSPLTDAPTFARDLEDAYRRAWRDFCGTPTSSA